MSYGEEIVEDSLQLNDTSEKNLSFAIRTPALADSCTGNCIETDSLANNSSGPSVLEYHEKLEIRILDPLDDSDTLTRDNWRNKEAANSGYFNTSLDEIEENSALDDLNVDISYESKSLLMLRAGNVMPGITLDGAIYYLHETQIFDSIVHILLCSALDIPMYRTSIEKSLNKTLQFILRFIKIKSCQEIYKERATLLKCLYSSNVSNEEQSNIVVHTIELTGTLSNTWKTCLNNEPSIYNEHDCKSCGSYITLIPILTVDPNIIVRKGLTALNEALSFHQYLKNVKCQRDGCLEICTVTAHPNFHICINFDVKSNNHSCKGIQCKLQDFPKTLNMEGLPGQYRLRGILSERSGRIVAHCLRVKDHWELYDNYLTTIVTSNSSVVIKPHGAVYIYS